jgi:hypothetical protein
MLREQASREATRESCDGKVERSGGGEKGTKKARVAGLGRGMIYRKGKRVHRPSHHQVFDVAPLRCMPYMLKKKIRKEGGLWLG